MIKNEIQRLRIGGFYAQINQLNYLNAAEVWLVRDEGDPTWKVLTCADGTPVGMRSSESQIASLCSTRAIDTENGTLLVNGKPIKAEQYLPLWREAPKVTASDFGREGHQLFVTIRRPATAMRAELVRPQLPQETKERLQALLQHPGFTDDDQAMSWKLDVLTPLGMQAYEALRTVYLSADDCADFDRSEHWQVHHGQAAADEVVTLCPDNLQPQPTNERQLSFSL